MSNVNQTISQKDRRKKEAKGGHRISRVVNLIEYQTLPPMAEFIKIGRQHDRAKLEMGQFNQSSSRKMGATLSMSQLADSLIPGQTESLKGRI
jgi:hypothetical protein